MIVMRIFIVIIACLCITHAHANLADHELQTLLAGKSVLTFKNLTELPDHYLKQSEYDEAPAKHNFMLKAIAKSLQLRDYHNANKLIFMMQEEKMAQDQHVLMLMLTAKLAIMKNENDAALAILSDISTKISHSLALVKHRLIAIAYLKNQDYILSLKERMKIDKMLLSEKAKFGNNKLIWELLNSTPNNAIDTALHSRQSTPVQAWLELASIRKAQNPDPLQAQEDLHLWQKKYKKHPGQNFVNKKLTPAKPTYNNHASSATIALLLPQHGKLSKTADHIQKGFLAAYYDAQKRQGYQPKIQVFDSSNDINNAYRDAVNSGASVIVGPLSKNNIHHLMKNRRTPLPVTTLALNYMANQNYTLPNFFQFGLSPRDEAKQAAERANLDNHINAFMITSAKAWGQNVAKTFEEEWHRLGGNIVEKVTVDTATPLKDTFKDLMKSEEAKQSEKLALENPDNSDTEDRMYDFERRHDIDFIFLAIEPELARQIVPLLKFYYAGDVPVYAISVVYNDDSADNYDLDGIFICDMPWLISKTIKARRARKKIAAYWSNHFGQPARLYAYGIDSYHLATYLIKHPQSTNVSLAGITGNLYSSPENRIFRQLPWAKLKNGKANIID